MWVFVYTAVRIVYMFWSIDFADTLAKCVHAVTYANEVAMDIKVDRTTITITTTTTTTKLKQLRKQPVLENREPAERGRVDNSPEWDKCFEDKWLCV